VAEGTVCTGLAVAVGYYRSVAGSHDNRCYTGCTVHHTHTPGRG